MTTVLLLFLGLPAAFALLLGLGVGWVGRLIPGGRFWMLAWALGTLFLPAVSLWGYARETALAAARAPQWASVWHTFQGETALLFTFVAGLTLWGAWRSAWWSPLPLLVLFPVFYKLILPPIFGTAAGPYDELLPSQLGGDAGRGLLLFCLLGASFLTGMLLIRPRGRASDFSSQEQNS